MQDHLVCWKCGTFPKRMTEGWRRMTSAQQQAAIIAERSEMNWFAMLSSGNPADGLRAVYYLGQILLEWEETQIRRARADGWSWMQIAGSLRVSRQAVHRRWARRLAARPASAFADRLR